MMSCVQCAWCCDVQRAALWYDSVDVCVWKSLFVGLKCVCGLRLFDVGNSMLRFNRLLPWEIGADVPIYILGR